MSSVQIFLWFWSLFGWENAILREIEQFLDSNDLLRYSMERNPGDWISLNCEPSTSKSGEFSYGVKKVWMNMGKANFGVNKQKNIVYQFYY